MSYVSIPKILTDSGLVTQCRFTSNSSSVDITNNTSLAAAEQSLVSQYNFAAGGFDLTALMTSLSAGQSAKFTTIKPSNIELWLERLSGCGYRIYASNNPSGRLLSRSAIGSESDLNIDKLYFFFITVNDISYTCGDIYEYTWPGGPRYFIRGNINQDLTINSVVSTIIDGAIVSTSDPYQFIDESTDAGGYGSPDYAGDPIGFPTLPTLSAANSGFVTLFTPTITQIQDLCSYMWSDVWDIATNFRKIFADPMDCILSLGIVPVTPVQEAAAKEIMVGNISTGVNSNYTSHQFYVQNMGVLHISEQTNSNMDYSPYTKAEIYLPFIGSRAVNIDDIMGADLELCYYIDLLSGACTAIMTVTKYNSDGSLLDSALYNYSGNCLANIPITSQNFTQMYQAIIGAASVAITAGTGAGMIAGAAAANLTHSTKLKSDISKSGNMSGSSGFMGVKKPYITITYPNICNVRNSNEVLGTPAFIGLGKSGSNTRKLSDFSGFTKMYKVDVTGVPCTTAERDLIEAALLEGVII